MCKFIKHIEIHDSWKAFVNDEIKAELISIENSIREDDYTPEDKLVLRFLQTDLSNVKIIILGKDPYPQKGCATGRSFEVGIKNTLNNKDINWNDVQINMSLKNIIKLIHKAYMLDSDSEVKSIDDVRSEIENKQLVIKSPSEIFNYWEKQGVLFLNLAYTGKIGGIKESGSHMKCWKNFTKELLSYIVGHNREIKYFLWGYSRKYNQYLLDKGVGGDDIYQSYHPCVTGGGREYKKSSYFLNSPCFQDTKEIVNWADVGI